jgi:nucleotide-binding universal stress UspA family protein
MSEEQVMKLSRKTATRYREAATILHGKPTLLGIRNILGHGEYNKYDKQMISKILVAMDGSESSLRAYEYASFLAKRCDAALIIVNICDIFEKITGEIKRELGDIAKKIEAEGGTGISIQLLEDYKSQAKDSGIKDVKTIRREGNAAAEILYIADEENVDTIVIGSKGVKSVKEFLLGGVSHKVIHHGKCPVTVIR